MLFKILFPLILIFSNAYSFNRLKVIVTIEPYQYLVQRIGKRKVKVVSLYKDKLPVTPGARVVVCRKPSALTLLTTAKA